MQNRQPTVFLHHFLYILLELLQENPGSIQMVMFLARIQALGLCVYPAEYRVYPGIFRPLIWSLQYNGSSISTMSIPLMLTVLVRILEAALLCCRLAVMNEMLLTMSCSASSSSSFSSSPLPISSLLVWHTEGRKWPLLLH